MVALRAIKVANIIIIIFYAIVVAFIELTFLSALYSAFLRDIASTYYAFILEIVNLIILYLKIED